MTSSSGPITVNYPVQFPYTVFIVGGFFSDDNLTQNLSVRAVKNNNASFSICAINYYDPAHRYMAYNSFWIAIGY